MGRTMRDPGYRVSGCGLLPRTIKASSVQQALVFFKGDIESAKATGGRLDPDDPIEVVGPSGKVYRFTADGQPIERG